MTWGFDAKRALPAPTARRGSAAQPFSHVGTEFAAIGPRERRFRARWDTDLPSFGRRENGPVHVATHAGGDRRPAINCRIAANRFRGIATSAIWKATYRPWLTTFAPILISFSRKLVSDQSLIASGVASVRRKLPRLYAKA